MCDTHSASHEATKGAACAHRNNTHNTDAASQSNTHHAPTVSRGDTPKNTPAVSYIDKTHATQAHTRSWSTQQIALCALLSSLSALCTLMLEFPIMPGITWLKYDPSVVVALLGGALFGPGMAVVLSIIPYLVHIGTATGVLGRSWRAFHVLALSYPQASYIADFHIV